MLKLFLVVAVFVAAAQASAKCSLRREAECMSGFRFLSKAKDSKEKICRVYRDIEKCLVLSHCKLQRYGGVFKAANEACVKGKCELTKVVACKLEVYEDMIKRNGSYCSEVPAYLKCYENTDCENLMKAEDRLMNNYCGSCIQKEVSCLKILKDVKKVEHNKEKICNLFGKTKSCLEKSKCNFKKYQNLVNAVAASCEGTCDLPTLVKCKSKLYKKLNITKENICQEYPKFDVCFKKTDCDDLYAANKKFMIRYCNKMNKS